MADDYQLVPVDHDPMGFVPVDHDPFAGDIARAMTPPPTMWDKYLPEINRKSGEVGDIIGNTPDALKVMGRYTPLGSLAARMGDVAEHGIDWDNPEEVKQLSGGTLLDMAGLAGGTAGAAERGTVGALGGKPISLKRVSSRYAGDRYGTEHEFNINRDDGQKIGTLSLRDIGDQLQVDWVQGKGLGAGDIRDMMGQLKEQFPDAKTIVGRRTKNGQVQQLSLEPRNLEDVAEGAPGAAERGTVGALGGKPGFTAYHGSPHDFDAFDASKTNQGIWLAKDPEAANRYTYGKGNLYKVDINAPRESFIDRNKSIGQQSESVRNAIAGIENDLGLPHHEDAHGGDFYANLARKLAGDGPSLQGLLKANNVLRERGIPGITDGDAHVVFDDRLVDITHKNDIPVGGTAGAAERGTVGALGGKPGLMAAASKAVPMGEGIATSAPRAHPAEDTRLAKNLMFGLTGEKTSPRYQEVKDWLKATQAEREVREKIQNKVLSMTPEELRNTPEWRDYLARRGEKVDLQFIPVDHDPFKK